MSQRLEFIRLYQKQVCSVHELCGNFGVSEKTGYKWIARFNAEGRPGLLDRSRAPQSSPQRVAASLVARIVALRKRHPTYGARKLREMLATTDPSVSWPAASTIGELLTRRGLVRHRRRRRAHGVPWDAATHGLTNATAPNAVWAADFKGQFRLADGRLCFPLTISDLYSRYLLACRALPSTMAEPVRSVFTRVFHEFGLPRVLRTDNGVPFAQPGALGRLSRLAVWWIRLGIRPERIAPGAPQQNGQHERMHRTLKGDAIRSGATDDRGQQRRFDQFRRDYNGVRPHESLAMQPPAAHYHPSPRVFPARLPAIEYPPFRELRLVTSCGFISFGGDSYALTKALSGEYVSLEETADDEWRVAFGPLTLGTIDARTKCFAPGVCWHEKARSSNSD